jgi:hypothetical protein
MLTLADFTRTRWTVSRVIDDRRGSVRGEFSGTASFVPQDDGLVYHEVGRLRMGEGPFLAAERRYLWLSVPDGIAVHFTNDRPFHRFRPEGRGPGTEHPCGADLYRVTYDFDSWPEWEAEWVVTGPAKDYRMVTTYRLG